MLKKHSIMKFFNLMVFSFLFVGLPQIGGAGASGPPDPLGPGITPQGMWCLQINQIPTKFLYGILS